MNPTGTLADAKRFTHEAMNTTFSLWFRGNDHAKDPAMARECFERIDYLESKLSRYVEGSDISQINQLDAGQTLYISEACHQCLLLSLEAFAKTCGLFDITIGARIEHRKSGDSSPTPPLVGRLTVHPDIAAVTCDEPGRQIDLGGIGKGFALDQLHLLLADWGAEDALLAAGASSLLAFGNSSWPVELTGSNDPVRKHLKNQSISASGTGIQGSHILHPAGSGFAPPAPCDRIWVVADTAASAEIWSTALMLVPIEDIPEFIHDFTEITSVAVEREGLIQLVR